MRTLGIERESWCCYLRWLGWRHLSLGVHIHLWKFNVELHLPFCFVRVGMVTDPEPALVSFHGPCCSCGEEVHGKGQWCQRCNELFCEVDWLDHARVHEDLA